MDEIYYADLTWPEVAALPRDLPVVIPLGHAAYDPASVARRIKARGLLVLPPVPYGFKARPGGLSALDVPPSLFARVMRGIQRELVAQGFERVSFLDGHGLSKSWQPRGIDMLPVRLSARSAQRSRLWTWPKDLRRRIVVVTTGHTEQHGHHLPLSTDTLIVDAIADGVQAACSDFVCCLPAWPYGVSTHTRQFPGTTNLGGRVFEDFFLAIVNRLIRLGAEMIFFSNGHGGNHSFLVNVVKYAGDRWPQRFVATEFLHTTGPALSQVRQSSLGGMGHGCELETSYILHLRPDLVHMDRATTEMSFISTPNYTMDWLESGRLIANPPWTDDTTSGIYGDATVATAEKGRRWLEAAIREKVELLQEVREQHVRRTAKRAERSSAA